jgi:hypothetical protein
MLLFLFHLEIIRGIGGSVEFLKEVKHPIYKKNYFNFFDCWGELIWFYVKKLCEYFFLTYYFTRSRGGYKKM